MQPCGDHGAAHRPAGPVRAMALSSYFLVTTDHRIPEIRRAGFLYLLIAHIGALGILLGSVMQVALLLPLSGRAQQAGIAVRDGFLAAYYQQDAASRPRVRLYDVAARDVPSAYLAAVADGAEAVVGPLTREEVADIETDKTSGIAPLSADQSHTSAASFVSAMYAIHFPSGDQDGASRTSSESAMRAAGRKMAPAPMVVVQKTKPNPTKRMVKASTVSAAGSRSRSPRKTTRTLAVPSEEETRILIEEAGDTSLGAAVRILASLGLRVGAGEPEAAKRERGRHEEGQRPWRGGPHLLQPTD